MYKLLSMRSNFLEQVPFKVKGLTERVLNIFSENLDLNDTVQMRLLFVFGLLKTAPNHIELKSPSVLKLLDLTHPITAYDLPAECFDVSIDDVNATMGFLKHEFPFETKWILSKVAVVGSKYYVFAPSFWNTRPLSVVDRWTFSKRFCDVSVPVGDPYYVEKLDDKTKRYRQIYDEFIPELLQLSINTFLTVLLLGSWHYFRSLHEDPTVVFLFRFHVGRPGDTLDQIKDKTTDILRQVYLGVDSVLDIAQVVHFDLLDLKKPGMPPGPTRRRIESNLDCLKDVTNQLSKQFYLWLLKYLYENVFTPLQSDSINVSRREWEEMLSRVKEYKERAGELEDDVASLKSQHTALSQEYDIAMERIEELTKGLQESVEKNSELQVLLETMENDHEELLNEIESLLKYVVGKEQDKLLVAQSKVVAGLLKGIAKISGNIFTLGLGSIVLESVDGIVSLAQSGKEIAENKELVAACKLLLSKITQKKSKRKASKPKTYANTSPSN